VQPVPVAAPPAPAVEVPPFGAPPVIAEPPIVPRIDIAPAATAPTEPVHLPPPRPAPPDFGAPPAAPAEAPLLPTAPVEPAAEPVPVELPPVVAVPIGLPGDDDPGDRPGQSTSPSEEVADERVGRSRRERIRRKASVRFPRRKSRMDSSGDAVADGWVTSEPASAEEEPEAIDPVEAARITDETLADAVRRLDPNTVLQGAGSLSRAGLALAPGEWVSTVVCGQVRGWPATVVRTDRRILVVVDRPSRPIVESLHPIATGVSLEADVAAGRFTVALVDRGRRLELHGVVELAAAEALLQRDALLH
jgi:hypothetical protein